MQSNFIEIALRHGCSPVSLLYIFRTPFPRNTSGWLLLNIIKDYFNNDDRFSRKTAIPRDKVDELVSLVLTTIWYTFNSQFYQQTDGMGMGGPASSIAAEIYMQAYERTAITTALHPPKVWEQFVDDVYSILKRTHLENFFHHINNLHQNIKFTMKKESNGELAFLDT